MRHTSIAVGALALLLLVAIPVGAAPSLQKGDQAHYHLSASISFLQSCETIGTGFSNSAIMCPLIAMIHPTLGINGTLDWTTIALNSTNASLNVTRDLSISDGEASPPIIHHVGSFNESINLATRIISLFPLIMPELAQALQTAQTSIDGSVPIGVSWSSSISMIDDTMVHRPVYTMWWVNGPLKLNQTIPVLALPTNVTGTTSVDLGGTLGTRTAWVLGFNITRSFLPPDPLATTTSLIPFGDGLKLAFTFNYDQTSDLLLSANAFVHLGFGEDTIVQPIPCHPSVSSTICPATYSPTIMMREFGVNIQASMKLTGTSVDLTHRLTLKDSSQDGNEGSQSSTGFGSGIATGTGSGSNLGTDTGSGPNSRTGGTTGGVGQPTSNSGQPKSPLQLSGSVPSLYAILGIIAAAIVGAGVWIARRRSTRTATGPLTSQSPV